MWSKEGVSEGQDGKQIKVEGWHIVDASTKELAKVTPGLPVRNQVEYVGSPYLYRSINITNYRGPTQWLAIAELAIPDNGNFPTNPDDPLSRVMKWNVQEYSVGKVSETDALRRLKKNSAGSIFPPMPKEYTRYRLTGRRYERFWNDDKVRRYVDKTNSNVMRLASRTILPYECVCKSIAPDGDFEDDAEYLMMKYVFEIGIDERSTDADPSAARAGYPFESHYADIGDVGWYASGSKSLQGKFCYVDENGAFRDYAKDVPLSGGGRPVNPEIMVQPFDRTFPPATPIQNPTTADHITVSYESPFSTANLRMWLYKDHLVTSFADILELV